MSTKSLQIKDAEKLLDYESIKMYFEDKPNVIHVTNKQGELELDSNIIDQCIDQMQPKPNLYGILTKSHIASQWTLRYIGQRKEKDIKQRLRQHLIKKHSKTGGQLEKMQ